ncbi:MAG: MFS transporter [Microscillaceae bacterium]|jgi:predicted MFS family arabinose efflux permease|nr:MFS transporter [Microscillaceae bacterium]
MKKETVIVILLASINFTHIMDFMIMMPLGPQLMRIFKISPQDFSLLVSAYTLSAGVSGFLAAFVVDKFDRRQVLLFGYTGFVVGTFACALAPTYALLFVARVVAGLFGGIIGAQVMSIIADLIPFERRGQAMGMLTTGFSVASVAGVPLGLYIAARASWHMPFVFIGVLGAIIIPLIYAILPTMTAHINRVNTKIDPLAVLHNVFDDPNQRLGLGLMVMLTSGHFVIIPLFTKYMVGNVGFTEPEIAYIYFIGGALTIFTSPMVGRLADKYGKYIILRNSILLSLIPVFLITNMSQIPIYYALVVTGLFFVFAGGRFIPAQAIVSEVVPPAQRGGYMSISSSVQQLASGIATLLSGAIVVETASGKLEHYNWVGYASILMIVTCIWIARQIKTDKHEKDQLVTQ